MPKKALQAELSWVSPVVWGCVLGPGWKDKLARTGMRLGGWRGRLEDSQEAPRQARDDQEGDGALQSGLGSVQNGLGAVQNASRGRKGLGTAQNSLGVVQNGLGTVKSGLGPVQNGLGARRAVPRWTGPLSYPPDYQGVF